MIERLLFPKTQLFRGSIDKLEIARGHDGFLRGGPDPVLIAAIYAATAKELRLVGRSLHKFESKTEFPTEVKPNLVELPSVVVQSEERSRFLFLAIMLEEDGGKDVQRLYGAVEHQSMLSAWAMEQAEVDPAPLASIAADAAFHAPTRVDLLLEGQPVVNTCKSDKWIGAVCCALPARQPEARSLYRFPFLAPNRKNDWTLIVTCDH
ncbi:MAG TPA: hypothetical protein VH054_18410 [Polyangiaceae bacterium]|jgi:hypothetical protein|nr:hypothetical protein [Polyangiaceae bacterium]